MNIAEALPVEQARVRRILQIYKALGPVGSFGAWSIEQDLAAADRAAAAGDVVAMIAACQTLLTIEA